MANQTVYPYGTGGSLPSSIGLINDLKTGGVDKALTAEQGKVLGNIIGAPGDMVVSQESYINAGAFSYWSGQWHTISDSSGRFIPISNVSRIKVQASQTKEFYGVFCTYIIQSNNTSISVSVDDNQTKNIVAGGEAEYSVPADSSFLWCQVSERENRAAPTVTLLNYPSDSGIMPLVESADKELNGATEDIRISPTSFILAGNFGFWSGTWHSSAAHYGAFVPVDGLSVVKVTTMNSKFYGVFCTGTEQANNSIVSISIVDGTAKSLNANSTELYSVPSDAKYLWYNVNVSDGRDTPLVFEPSESSGLNNRVDLMETMVSNLETSVDGMVNYVAFGTDDDWLTSNNVQVFYNTARNKAAYHNSSGHWLVDGVKCCKNPVVYEDCPDMSIIVAGDYIYGYSSGSHGKIFRSTNFAIWENTKKMILPLATYSNYWAPDVNYLDNKYVIYFTINGGMLVVATSEIPAPDNGFTVEASIDYSAIDYCYCEGVLFYAKGGIKYRTMTDYKTPSDTEVSTNMVGEGAMIWHHGDYYYAFTSLGASQSYSYSIGVYRSSTLQSTTWEYGGIILKSTSEEMLCGPGHISEIFEDSEGHYFAMMQVHIYDSGWSFRPTSIQELIVNNSDWPEFVDYQGNTITSPQLLCRAPVMPVTIQKTATE